MLLTGGAGYLGSVVVPMLLSLDYDVTVVDLFLFDGNSLAAVASHPGLLVCRENIASFPLREELLDGIDVVIHLAGVASDAACERAPEAAIETNERGTTTLAGLARTVGVPRFIFASSCGVYGASGNRVLDEVSPTTPRTLYAQTKLAAERGLFELSGGDFDVTVLRFGTLFGLSPRMRFDLVVNTMTRRALAGGPLVVNGDGSQHRPFVHVADAARALVSVVEAERAVVGGQIFNVGTLPLSHTIHEVSAYVQQRFPGLEVRHHADRADPVSCRVNGWKLRDAVGFAPALGVLDGVDEISVAARGGRLHGE